MSDGSTPRLSVLIPAFNEEDVIAETLAEAAEVLAGLSGPHEILVCDDGSTDATWAVLEEAAARMPELRLLRHEQNRGNPAAQRTLVEAARGEVLFHIGADREWRMAEIPRLLEKLEEGYDIVIGVRRNKQYTLGRKLVSRGYNVLVWLLWGRYFGDLGSIKMARAALWKRLPFSSDSAFVHAERVLIAHRNGARIATVDVEHRRRRTGESKYADPRQALRALRELFAFRLSPRSRARIPDWRP